MPEESVSSIGSLAPADLARGGVRGERVRTESMTLLLAKRSGPSVVAEKLRLSG